MTTLKSLDTTSSGITLSLSHPVKQINNAKLKKHYQNKDLNQLSKYISRVTSCHFTSFACFSCFWSHSSLFFRHQLCFKIFLNFMVYSAVNLLNQRKKRKKERLALITASKYIGIAAQWGRTESIYRRPWLPLYGPCMTLEHSVKEEGKPESDRDG